MLQKQSQSLQNQSCLRVLQTNYFLDCSDLLLLSLIQLAQKLQYAKVYTNSKSTGRTVGLRLPAVVSLDLEWIMFLFAPVSISVSVLSRQELDGIFSINY